MTKIPSIHPGEILSEDFLIPMNITAYRLAKKTHIHQTRISEIINGKRGISIDTALRFSKFFGNSAEFWLNIQNHYDLEVKKQFLSGELEKIETFVYVERDTVQTL
ncbi:MAG: HigA family addiction module antidote protein [bacterium]|nr:HigA family addiction module antidote protein [bacterium]